MKLSIKWELDAMDFEGLYIVYIRDIPWKFRRKQCIEKDSATIPLKYLFCKGKLFIEVVDDAVNSTIKEIKADHRELGEKIKILLVLDRIMVKELQ